jgi:transcriptional regulator with XRE-family HTH domain
MSHSSHTFRFTPEMGRRLRQIRESIGFKQSDVARMMGRTSRGAGNIISRLENGKVPYPSLGLIADYLRACDRSFHAIADVLSAYVKESARKVRPGEVTGRVGTAGRKPARPPARMQSAAAGRKAMLEQRLFQLLSAKGAPKRVEERELLARFGRKVFQAMERQRGGLVRGRVPPEAVAQMQRAMAEFSRELEAGAVPPVPARRGGTPGPVKRAERLLRTDYRNKLAWYRAARYYAGQRIATEVANTLHDETGLPSSVRAYVLLVPRLFAIAAETAPASTERESRLAEFLAGIKDKPRVQRIAEYVFQRHEELKKNFPPAPEDWYGAASPGPKGFA